MRIGNRIHPLDRYEAAMIEEPPDMPPTPYRGIIWLAWLLACVAIWGLVLWEVL